MRWQFLLLLTELLAFDGYISLLEKFLIALSPQVPAKTDCVMCFGPVVPDGYGICYNPMDEHINFAISAFNSCADTNAARMAHYLEKALLDMRILLQSTPKSKL